MKRLLSGHKRFDLVGALTKNKMAEAGFGILAVFVVLALLAPLIAHDPLATMVDSGGRFALSKPPSSLFLFGTTPEGWDVFSQFIWGAREVLVVGFASAVITASFGFFMGLLSGFYRGVVDTVIMRTVDLLYSLPFEALAIAVLSIIGGSELTIMLMIFIVFWRQTARVVRSRVLSIRELEYVKAAKVVGASNLRIIFRHIAPNLLGAYFLFLSITCGWAIMADQTLNFLGFGDPHLVTWGTMLNLAFLQGAMVTGLWWWIIPPGVGTTLLVASMYFMGQWYRGV